MRVAIRGRLVKEGENDVNVFVHSYYVGRPSPCVIIENGVNLGLIDGHIEDVDEIFQYELARHPGYCVKERIDVVAVLNPGT
jgi:hypothetical protein